MFDVSHLGAIRVAGFPAYDRLQETLSNDLRRIRPGSTQYSHLLDDSDGSVVDDVIVWWLEPEDFIVVANASNTATVRAALHGSDITRQRALIAVQGPGSRRMLKRVFPDAAEVPHNAVSTIAIPDMLGGPITSGAVGGVGGAPTDCIVAGTGYTGEDGVEIHIPPDSARQLFMRLVEEGAVPAGLGARDSLRLEAGLPLFGHELGRGITPLDARLGWVIGWDKQRFNGRDALLHAREAGPERLLWAVVGEGRRPLRDGDRVFARLASDGQAGNATDATTSSQLPVTEPPGTAGPSSRIVTGNPAEKAGSDDTEARPAGRTQVATDPVANSSGTCGAGHEVELGALTSGGYGPSLQRGIGLALLPADCRLTSGIVVSVVRGNTTIACIVTRSPLIGDNVK